MDVQLDNKKQSLFLFMFVKDLNSTTSLNY
jgi:hypothetical protein